MKKVQLVQLNNKYGSQVYLPYSAGMLQAYAQSDPEISDNFEFNDFVFVRENLDKMVMNIGQIDVLGVSCYVWNWALSLRLAEEVRKKNPNCLIVFGGPQVPNNDHEFFDKHYFIDVAVHGEGEITFAEILKRFAEGGIEATNHINGTTFHNRRTGQVFKAPPRDRLKDLNVIPSPYLEGVFDSLLERDDYKWMITWETNRGCPFRCSFCDWGSAIATKVRKFSEERLFAEIDYFTEKKVDLVFGADANFGIYPRDKEFTLKLAGNKQKTGFPNQFRVCFTKNTTDKVFELAKIFSEAGMNKGVSISMQSLNDDTLEKIQRKNIKMSFFNDLQKKYVEAGLVTYTELILPLPGETYDSFVSGIDTLLDSSQHSGIVIYNCSIMPNAEMGDIEYQKKHGFDMIEIPVFQAHSDLVDEEEIVEKETIVVGTNSMSREEFVKTYKFGWTIQSMHLLGLLQVVSITLRNHFGITYSDFYEGLIEYGCKNPNSIFGNELNNIDRFLANVFEGGKFGQSVDDCDEINWPPEEATFLRISKNIDQFYYEIKEFIWATWPELCKEVKIIQDIVFYQQSILSTFDNQNEYNIGMNYNVHDFFNESRAGIVSELIEGYHMLQIKPSKEYDDMKQYSREVVWFGRKGGKFFHPVEKK